MTKSGEVGSASMFGVVLMGGILSVSAIMSSLQKVALKSRENSQRMSTSNAFISNLSAISLLHAKLDSLGEEVPEFKVVGNNIQGHASSSITIRDGHAIISRDDVTRDASLNPDKFFGGTTLPGSLMSTDLQIIQTKEDADRIYYVVKAISKTNTNFGSKGIETLGAINIRKISLELPETDPVDPPGAFTPETCKGKSLFGHCYFLSAGGISPIATCKEKGMAYDAEGTESLPLSDASCNAVLDALGTPNPGPMKHTFPNGKYNGVGCKYYYATDWMNGRWNETIANPNQGGGKRAVACKKL
ncbi:MAG: hypothetical protein EOP04_01205 [Proteobacteria bacterium]|nr:MAG: hypothetical protein EOP04_01205 [Pseudomonadota bacterium]